MFCVGVLLCVCVGGVCLQTIPDGKSKSKNRSTPLIKYKNVCFVFGFGFGFVCFLFVCLFSFPSVFLCFDF